MHLSAYLAFFRARLRMLLQYRSAAWAGVVTQIVFGWILVSMRGAFYAHSKQIPPMPYAEMVTYTWLGQALFAMTPYLGNPDPEVRESIRSGNIAYDLTRPVDIHTVWWVRNMASRLAPTLLRSGPVVILALWFFRMQPPPSVLAFLCFLLAMMGALLLISSLITLLLTCMFWTTSGDGLMRLTPALSSTLSGQILPLSLFPDSIQPLLKFLPFSGMVDAPYRFWSGGNPPEAIGGVLLHQLLWTLCFVLLGRFLLRRGMQRLVVAGG
jgi:ABC-2 type transport system permease protein